MIKKISDLEEIVAKQKKKKLVLVVAQDEQALLAVYEAQKRGIIDAVLVGDASEIKKIADKNELNLSAAEIIDEKDIKKAVKLSVKLVHDKKAEILMKGYVATSTLLKAVLNKDWGLRSGRLLSHLALFETKTYHKLLAITDVAMNIAPDLQDKTGIVENSVECLNNIGITNPKVAILGAVETVSPNMQATLDAALISKMAQRGQIKNCIVDGPLALDTIISAESSDHKGIKSEVAKDADLIIMPNIEAGNVLYKALVFFAKAKNAGIILGANAPIVLTSRSDSLETKFNSIILASASHKK